MIRKDKDVAYVLTHLFNREGAAIFQIFNTESGVLAHATTDASVLNSKKPLPAFMLIDPSPSSGNCHAGEFTTLPDITGEELAYLRKIDQGRHSTLRNMVTGAFVALPQRAPKAP